MFRCLMISLFEYLWTVSFSGGPPEKIGKLEKPIKQLQKRTKNQKNKRTMKRKTLFSAGPGS